MRLRNLHVLTAVVILSLSIGRAAEPQTSDSLKLEQLQEEAMSRPDVVLLDVRTAEEYAERHLKDAILIDVTEPGFLGKCQRQLPVDKTVAVYCRTGFRSKSAGNLLAEAGYDVINMKGGITAWVEAGKEVVK